ncbi:hypothetical protein [Buchnera aphidicola]|uniref:hypothetical protein n=1 Tax=Buchnera aphidicola TaxID=9 RepID=UPI003464D4CF
MNNVFKKKSTIQKITYNSYTNYLIIEQDFFITQQTIKKILHQYFKLKYTYLNKIYLTKKKDLKEINYKFKQQNIFLKKQIFLIEIDKKKIKFDTFNTIKSILNHHIHNNILIVYVKNINQETIIEKIKQLSNSYQIKIIYCQYLSKNETKKWIKKKNQVMKLDLKQSIIDILSYYYERNLLLLYKTLKMLKIISINKKIKTKCVKKIIHDNVNFNIQHLIKSIFQNKKKQITRILNYLQYHKYDINVILRYIQNYLIQYIKLKYQKKNDDKNNMNHKNLNYDLNHKKLYILIKKLVQLDIDIKKKNKDFLWNQLKIYIMML